MKFTDIIFNEMKFIDINTFVKNKYITVKNSKSVENFLFLKLNKLDYFIKNYKKENIIEECFFDFKNLKDLRLKNIRKTALKFKKFLDNKNENIIFEYIRNNKEQYYFFFQNNVFYNFLNYKNEIMFGTKKFKENESKAIGFLLEDFETERPDKSVNTQEAVSKIFNIIKDRKIKEFIFNGEEQKKNKDKSGKTSRERLYFYMLDRYFGKDGYIQKNKTKDNEFHIVIK